MSNNVEIKQAVDFVCSCGKRVTVGYATEDGSAEVPCALHAWPHCKKFGQMDLNDYLESERKLMEC